MYIYIIIYRIIFQILKFSTTESKVPNVPYNSPNSITSTNNHEPPVKRKRQTKIADDNVFKKFPRTNSNEFNFPSIRSTLSSFPFVSTFSFPPFSPGILSRKPRPHCLQSRKRYRVRGYITISS